MKKLLNGQYPKTYQIKFEFRNELGEWKEDYYWNGGRGWVIRDAEAIAEQLKREYVRNVRIEEITK